MGTCSSCGKKAGKKFIVELANGKEREVASEQEARTVQRMNPGSTYRVKS